MNCACSIETNPDAEPVEFCSKKSPIAKIKHPCSECARWIMPGEQYNRYEGKWGDGFVVYKHCSDCASVVEHMFTNYTFGCVWDDVQAAIEEGEKIPEKCISSISTAARAKVCDMIEKQWASEEDDNAERPRNQA